ncbi:hypothetical protein D3C73_679180 [compost metagenome]
MPRQAPVAPLLAAGTAELAHDLHSATRVHVTGHLALVGGFAGHFPWQRRIVIATLIPVLPAAFCGRRGTDAADLADAVGTAAPGVADLRRTVIAGADRKRGAAVGIARLDVAIVEALERGLAALHIDRPAFIGVHFDATRAIGVEERHGGHRRCCEGAGEQRDGQREAVAAHGRLPGKRCAVATSMGAAGVALS